MSIGGDNSETGDDAVQHGGSSETSISDLRHNGRPFLLCLPVVDCDHDHSHVLLVALVETFDRHLALKS